MAAQAGILPQSIAAPLGVSRQHLGILVSLLCLAAIWLAPLPGLAPAGQRRWQ